MERWCKNQSHQRMPLYRPNAQDLQSYELPALLVHGELLITFYFEDQLHGTTN